MDWRDEINPIIKSHLETQIKETAAHKDAYSKAKEPTKAQLWIAIANLSKQIFDLHLRIKVLEKAMVDLAPQKKKKGNGVDASKALKDVLKKL